ncbi:MAG: DUF4249 family protein [Ignavibacteriales bacterium]|nr:DUF4249 family protein [Ignavibacteriales bacterium]
MKMKLILSLVLISGLMILNGCGDPSIDPLSFSYEPKIVVNAIIYPGEQINDIQITRNIPLNSAVDSNKFMLTPGVNRVVVTVNGIPLDYDPATKSYGTDKIVVGYASLYKLEVSAEIEGKLYSASAQTTTPTQDFTLVNSQLGTLRYSDPVTPKVEFTTIPGVDFYLVSVLPEHPTLDNFIFENSYNPNPDREDVAKELNIYVFHSIQAQNILTSSPVNYGIEIRKFNYWFYDTYRVVVYAGDQNFRNFVITSQNVKDAEGNFHEPLINIKGDGIGVFASAVKKVASFTITR